jgi:hypothetical protein
MRRRRDALGAEPACSGWRVGDASAAWSSSSPHRRNSWRRFCESASKSEPDLFETELVAFRIGEDDPPARLKFPPVVHHRRAEGK